jgi:hypothetical protein
MIKEMVAGLAQPSPSSDWVQSLIEQLRHDLDAVAGRTRCHACEQPQCQNGPARAGEPAQTPRFAVLRKTQYAEPAVMQSRGLDSGQNTARFPQGLECHVGLALRIIPPPSARKGQGPPEQAAPRLRLN